MKPTSNTCLGDEDDLLLTTRDGQEIRTGALRAQGELFSFVGINKHGMQLTMNPNVAHHPYLPIKEKQLRPYFDAVQKELKENIGIIVNLDYMKVGRSDLNRDAMLSRSPNEYSLIYQSLDGKRMNAKQYPSGALFVNGQRELGIYNVTQKFEDKKLFNVMPKGYENYTRFEPRLMKPRAHRKETQYSTIPEIISNYDSLADTYRNGVIRVFGDSVLKPDLHQNQIHSDLMLFESYDCKANYFMRHFGIEGIILKYGSIDAFICQVIEVAPLTKQKRYNQKSFIRKKYKEYLSNTPISIETKYTSMYQELIDKFIAA